MSRSTGAEQQQARRGKRLATAAVGAVLVAGLAIGAVTWRTPTGAPRLQIGTVAQDTALAVTLNPDAAQQMLADAKSCRVPLAHIQIWHTEGVPDAVVQLRSGSYVSPPFKLTTGPERIALPFPSNYAAGAGVISVVGKAQAVNVTLSPVIRFTEVNGVAPISVKWATDRPCG